jgi:hypothetical protein
MDAASKLFTRRQGVTPPPPPPPASKQRVPVLAVPSIALGSIALPKLPTLPSGQLIGTAITYLFYLSAAVFFIFLLLVFVHFTITPVFSLSPYDKGIIGISTSQDKETAWTDAPATNTMKTTILNPKSCDYTISFDVLVPATYQPITAPRVLFYRSATEVAMLASAKTSDLKSIFPTTNILAYIDSSKNDLNVYVMTTSDAAASVFTSEPLPPIRNIPQGTPFRLSIAFMPNYIEVYIDGKLNATTIIKGTPVRTETQFWPPPASVASAVQVGKFYYWPRALMASELQSLVSTSADFFKKTV